MVKSILFNGRRPGDIDRAKIEDFEKDYKSDPEDPYFKELNPKKKSKASKYEKTISKGKKLMGLTV